MTFSVIVRGHDEETLRSLRAQSLGGAQWHVVDDAEGANRAIDVATGSFVALVDAGDVLPPDALATMAAAIERDPAVGYLYSDEARPDGVFRKPDWSPERLRHHFYTGGLSVLRTELVRGVGGFRPEYGAAQEHDLVLRVTERADTVVHVPEVLYRRRSTLAPAGEAGRRAVQDHLDRLGLPATAQPGEWPGFYRVTRDPGSLPSASLVFPTRGDSGTVRGEERVFIVEAVRSCLARTSLDPEVVVVGDEPMPAGVVEELREICDDRLVFVPYREEFNFSLKCNTGFVASSGEAVVLMNDDIEAIADGWLEELLGPLTESDVGMTGAKLLFEDGTLQHGGHVYAGPPVHAHYGRIPGPDVAFGATVVNREASGVTAACAALRREVFEEAGGFTPRLPLNYNDVDLCLKVRHLGYRIVWVTGAELYHFESQTRVPVVHQWERRVVNRRWGWPKADRYTPAD